MKWFVPSFGGDFRLEPESDKSCLLTVAKVTPGEVASLGKFFDKARCKGWTESAGPTVPGTDGTYRLGVNLKKAGPLLVKLTKPGKAVLTAVKFTNGKLVIEEGSDPAVLKVDSIETTTDAGGQPQQAEEPKAAVSTSRPTPCCPNCYVDPARTQRASEVLETFLSPAEVETWREHHVVYVDGGVSGHRYAVAHRHSPFAAAWSRITFDLDDGGVVHFHHSLLPPEEEVLSAKLILGSHLEPWLRNEATCLGGMFTDG